MASVAKRNRCHCVTEAGSSGRWRRLSRREIPKQGLEHLTAEEEVVSRIWPHVDGLRAELIAHLQLQDQPGYRGQAEDHRQAALRQHDALRDLIQKYVKTYCNQLIEKGETGHAVKGL